MFIQSLINFLTLVLLTKAVLGPTWDFCHSLMEGMIVSVTPFFYERCTIEGRPLEVSIIVAIVVLQLLALWKGWKNRKVS
jgi:hypothetical protein